MTEKDPKDMTAAELLRWTANGDPDEHGNTFVGFKLFAALSGKRYISTTNDDDARNTSALAGKIDAEIEAARRDAAKEPRKPMFAIRRIIASGTDWPEPRDGEGLRDWLERCWLPRPRDEAGEPVQFGEDTDKLHEVEKFIFTRSGDCCQMQDARGNMQNAFPGQRVKRRVPEVLGGDGLPIKVGETAWDMASGLEIVVSRIAKDEDGNVIVCANGDICELQFAPKNIIHTPPDTQERINADVMKEYIEYWGCVGMSCEGCPAKIDGKKPWRRYNVGGCHEAMVLDLLRRQRQLDARKGGVE